MNRALLILLGAATLAACGNGTTSTPGTAVPTSEPESITRATIAAPELQPPSQRSRPDYALVVYDPCTYIDDQTIIDAGYDPGTRERFDADTLVTQYGCVFDAQRRDLVVASLNGSFDNDRAARAEYSTPLPPINGRDAFLSNDPLDRFACEVTMRTRAGLVVVSTTVKVQYDTDEPCAGIVETATLIEKTIGEEN